MNTADISILYQDHSLLILNKPAGIVIHPTYKHGEGDTLWDALLLYLEQAPPDPWLVPDLPDDPEWLLAPEGVRDMLREKRNLYLQKRFAIQPRPCLLHRLDKDTSGVVALARNESTRRHVVKQFHAHTIQKRYLALVQPVAPLWASPRAPLTCTVRQEDGYEQAVDVSAFSTLALQETLLLDGPLDRDPGDRRRCIVFPEGQQARTSFSILGREQEYTLLEVQPITGRTHQIRAHLTAAGYSLVGDQVYAPNSLLKPPATLLPRQFLHAASLTLRDYPKNNPLTFVAPLPSDLTNWLAQYSPHLLELALQITNQPVLVGRERE